MPAIPGVRFRRFRDEGDYARMASVVNRSKQTDGFEHTSTADRIGQSLRHAPGWVHETDLMLVDAGDDTVAYCVCLWLAAKDDVQIFYHIGFVLPEWRRHGIGAALLEWVERRQRAAAAAMPPVATRWHQAVAVESERAKTALLLKHSYLPVRYSYRMLCSLDPANRPLALPAEITVRPVQPEHFRAIYEATNEAFLDHWGDTTLTWEEFNNWATFAETDLTLWKAAWHGNEVVGAALGEIPRAENVEYGRMRGYIANVAVRRAWRGRGIARGLISQLMRDFCLRGYTEAALDVDTENPTGALRLYESLGFAPIRKEVAYRKALRIDL